MSWPLAGRDFVLGMVAGAAAALALGAALFAAVLRSSPQYSLGHWKLNVRPPFSSMWMNLGYWVTPDGEPVEHFDEACLGLLQEVLRTAGVLDRIPRADAKPRTAVSLLDLGIGCGDQTVALARLIQPQTRHDLRYVGLTLDELQLRAASRKLDRELAPSSAGTDGSPAPPRACFKLFRADAAKPDSWSPAVGDAVQALADESVGERWLLALDCLYHFFPSRRPVFRHAAHSIGAGVMAFDLMLNEKASWRDTLLLRMVGRLLGCPLHAFLTEHQYRAQLVECGYDRNGIIVRDVSDHVFAGVVHYLGRQELVLSQYGISIGGFKLAAKVFGWFDRSRVVKAVIVVGRTKGTESK